MTQKTLTPAFDELLTKVKQYVDAKVASVGSMQTAITNVGSASLPNALLLTQTQTDTSGGGAPIITTQSVFKLIGTQDLQINAVTQGDGSEVATVSINGNIMKWLGVYPNNTALLSIPASALTRNAIAIVSNDDWSNGERSVYVYTGAGTNVQGDWTLLTKTPIIADWTKRVTTSINGLLADATGDIQLTFGVQGEAVIVPHSTLVDSGFTITGNSYIGGAEFDMAGELHATPNDLITFPELAPSFAIGLQALDATQITNVPQTITTPMNGYHQYLQTYQIRLRRTSDSLYEIYPLVVYTVLNADGANFNLTTHYGASGYDPTPNYYNAMDLGVMGSFGVQTVDGVSQDANGNVQIDAVKSVNLTLPDGTGDVTLPVSSATDSETLTIAPADWAPSTDWTISSTVTLSWNVLKLGAGSTGFTADLQGYANLSISSSVFATGLAPTLDIFTTLQYLPGTNLTDFSNTTSYLLRLTRVSDGTVEEFPMVAKRTFTASTNQAIIEFSGTGWNTTAGYYNAVELVRGGLGGVSTVNQVHPDNNGNVALGTTFVSALQNQSISPSQWFIGSEWGLISNPQLQWVKLMLGDEKEGFVTKIIDTVMLQTPSTTFTNGLPFNFQIWVPNIQFTPDVPLTNYTTNLSYTLKLTRTSDGKVEQYPISATYAFTGTTNQMDIHFAGSGWNTGSNYYNFATLVAGFDQTIRSINNFFPDTNGNIQLPPGATTNAYRLDKSNGAVVATLTETVSGVSVTIPSTTNVLTWQRYLLSQNGYTLANLSGSAWTINFSNKFFTATGWYMFGYTGLSSDQTIGISPSANSLVMLTYTQATNAYTLTFEAKSSLLDNANTWTGSNYFDSQMIFSGNSTIRQTTANAYNNIIVNDLNTGWNAAHFNSNLGAVVDVLCFTVISPSTLGGSLPSDYNPSPAGTNVAYYGVYERGSASSSTTNAGIRLTFTYVNTAGQWVTATRMGTQTAGVTSTVLWGAWEVKGAEARYTLSIDASNNISFTNQASGSPVSPTMASSNLSVSAIDQYANNTGTSGGVALLTGVNIEFTASGEDTTGKSWLGVVKTNSTNAANPTALGSLVYLNYLAATATYYLSFQQSGGTVFLRNNSWTGYQTFGGGTSFTAYSMYNNNAPTIYTSGWSTLDALPSSIMGNQATGTQRFVRAYFYVPNSQASTTGTLPFNFVAYGTTSPTEDAVGYYERTYNADGTARWEQALRFKTIYNTWIEAVRYGTQSTASASTITWENWYEQVPTLFPVRQWQNITLAGTQYSLPTNGRFRFKMMGDRLEIEIFGLYVNTTQSTGNPVQLSSTGFFSAYAGMANRPMSSATLGTTQTAPSNGSQMYPQGTTNQTVLFQIDTAGTLWWVSNTQFTGGWYFTGYASLAL